MTEKAYHSQMHRVYRAVKRKQAMRGEGIDPQKVAREFARQVKRLELVVPQADADADAEAA